MPSWPGPPLPPHWTASEQPRLVGRQAELRAFREAWGAAADGARQVVLVGGEGGAGKSRSVIDAATECARSGAAVLVGTCVAELGSPYQPFAEPVDALWTAVTQGALAPGAPESVDGLADRLALLAARRQPDPAASAGREYGPQLYGAVVGALRATAARRPVVLVLEDLHWAAPDGLQLLVHLVQHTADVPMLVLATHRTSLPDRSPAVVHALAELYRLPGVRRLDLPPLGVDDITEFLVRESGEPAVRARAAAAALQHHTGGNPFFLREVWRDLRSQGGLSALRGGTIRAPDSVRDTFQARLDRLPGQPRQLLELAAVLGDEVDLDTLLALDEATSAPAGPDALLGALDGAVALGLLEPVSGPDGPYRFVHALARQAVLDLMPPSRLTRCHAVAAETIERRPGTLRRTQRLAHHYSSARTLGYGRLAGRYLVESALIADRALAHEEAAALFERAAELTGASDEVHELWLAAARSHFLAADFPRARELDEQVMAGGRPQERLRAAIGYEAASWHLGQHGHRAVELLTSALAGVERDPTDPVYVRAISSLGRALAFTGDVEEAAALADRAIQLARDLGRSDLLGRTLQAGLHIGTGPERSALRLERALELTALAERTGELGQLSAAAYHRAFAGYLTGDRRLVDDAHADVLRAARMTGQKFWEYVAGGFDYARHYLAGQFDAAESAACRQRELGRAVSAADNAEGPYAMQTFMVRRASGRLDDVRPLITGTERPTDRWAPGLLALYTELGLRGPAERILRWLLEEGLEHYEPSSDWPATLVFTTEAALLLGDDVAARSLRPRLMEFAGHNLSAGPFVAVFGSADRYLGRVDSLLGNAAAGDWFESAAAMDMRMSAPVHVAETLAAEALHLRRTGAPAGRIHELVERVREVAEPLGMRRVLGMVGMQPAAARAGVPARPDGLTGRELEILRLVAAGMSNRGIAQRLVISESTAANHVRSIFLKTGAANRTQAARYAADRDLLG